MAIKYVVVQKTNPMNRDVKKFYAVAKTNEITPYSDLCKKVSNSSSATRGDVSLVLESLIFEMITELSKGHIVRLGEFGSFQMSINSMGAETAEDFNPGLIKKSRIVFRPGALLRDMRSTASYEVLDRRLWPVPKK